MTEAHTGLRPSWDDWALGVAHAVGPGPTGRADCTRRRVGACIVEPLQHRIIGAGYNGAEPGGPSCLKGECPRGRHYLAGCPCGGCHDEHCAGLGTCDKDFHCTDPQLRCACGGGWPCSDAVPPGSSYDTGPGTCIASHAEINCLMDVDARHRLNGATLYVTEKPCDGCMKIIRTTRIAWVVWPAGRIECHPAAA